MVYDFSELKRKAEEASEWLSKEYLGIRTGRAAPALLDNVTVESYGARVLINQVGNVSVEDARSLRISVWDKEQISAVEKAINDADFGVGVSSDEAGVRVSFPELTGERRQALVKLAKDKLENARISLRGARDDTWNDIQKKTKDGEMSEDDKFRAKDDMQKLVDEANKKLDDMAEKKEQEIMN
ncbi:MAG: ribosome recycling factor [Candidatus Pacebacteria bacterium]|jgi:ribosome recycling factor|nr:ribosome recycling factor [bacterium]MDP6527421.1 ribosome recycling factor [Candidatus Paceibacterota bacterium]MDP6659672.1 ribosome recycling factor [Candidatus Paceibacterota bacterium]|tara:strand:+ start:11665 stop:12216 length:552 start_codon:yes stop_codon:yes gene_type:complete